MLNNIKLCLEACEQLNLTYEILHSTCNLFRVKIGDKFHYFVNYSTPLNNQAVAYIFKDKEYLYTVLKDKIRTPYTLSFLSPFCKEQYRKYLECKDIETIVESIKANSTMPVIVKRNTGSGGNNVFLCRDAAEIKTAIEKIFNVNDKNYDYIALAQQYVDIDKEYRAVVLHNELILLYEKDNKGAEFIGNLSPLHWEGAKARHITDLETLAVFSQFIQPIFEEINVAYSGLDIAIDKSGQFWLIEMNSHPNYDIFTRDNGSEPAVEVFKKLLMSLEKL